MKKNKVLLFARSFLTKYYSEINSEKFETVFVALTKEERLFLEQKNCNVIACFEELYEKLEVAAIPDNYLETSFISDRFLCRFNYKKRLEILGKEISFWNEIFNKEKPNLLVNETVAIEIAEVMAIEAKKRNIPFATHLLGFLPQTFYWKPNPFHGSLNELLINSIKLEKEYIQKAEEYIHNTCIKNEKPFYIMQSFEKSRYNFKRFCGSIYRDFFKMLKEKKLQKKMFFRYEDYSIFCFLYAKQVINSIFYRYNKLSDIENINFIFYPLHVEPEATLSYFAEEFQYQDSTIRNIARSLKPNQYLVVKEHPQQFGSLLFKKFRRLKKENKNIIFLPSEIPSEKIICNCDAIITLTSSAAWEGLLMRKPVFVLGKIFFDEHPAVKKIDGFLALKEELRSTDYKIPRMEENIEFVARMISIFNKGVPAPNANMDFNENIKEYTLAIEKLLIKS